MTIPFVPGVLSADQVSATGASIAAMQESSGAIPWTPGEHTDIWNHVEAAMALMLTGNRGAAERAYDWAVSMQRSDGSWPMKIVAGEIEDASGETNMSAYLAVGAWHHWLLTRDRTFLRRLWPSVRRGLDWVVSMQLPWGGIAWSQEWREGRPAKVNAEALLAGSSSIYQSLRAGVAIAELLGDEQPEWELAGGRLGHALREHRDLFLDKSQFSMDWYYPILGGAVRGDDAHQLVKERWDTFVSDGLGIRCVSDNPWFTGAETCELVMALDAIGDDRARQLFADIQHLRHENASYWTGWVVSDEYPDGVHWPHEQTTYTAAAVILAADELSNTSAASGLMRGEHLSPDFREFGLECGCPDSSDRSADRVASGA